ncbi:hypothetical protein RJD39_06040 [Vibrio scophthalmi]|uniref:hypothetical protein n=1 Tax=Vibrio TaxID=662 RepID=UPI00021BDC1F|nr:MULTISPECIES: hypothetical protein [Vibrio]EGU31104.1 hypothetical protein VIBRN418_17278 [Vibrio sp. N418]MCY9805383.1 hypothetical protein [Vibrio scophthalmi]
MKKPVRKNVKKMRKSDFEERFTNMVGEYNQAKEILESLAVGTAEYNKQKKQCDTLFASAERFINSVKN